MKRERTHRSTVATPMANIVSETKSINAKPESPAVRARMSGYTSVMAATPTCCSADNPTTAIGGVSSTP